MAVVVAGITESIKPANHKTLREFSLYLLMQDLYGSNAAVVPAQKPMLEYWYTNGPQNLQERLEHLQQPDVKYLYYVHEDDYKWYGLLKELNWFKPTIVTNGAFENVPTGVKAVQRLFSIASIESALPYIEPINKAEPAYDCVSTMHLSWGCNYLLDLQTCTVLDLLSINANLFVCDGSALSRLASRICSARGMAVEYEVQEPSLQALIKYRYY